MNPVTWNEIAEWLMARDPWPQQILQGIARAAVTTTNGTISSNHLLHDPLFDIADNQVNTIPAGFRVCCQKGWLTKVGTEPTETLRGHGRDVKVYQVTDQGFQAFRILAELDVKGRETDPREPLDVELGGYRRPTVDSTGLDESTPTGSAVDTPSQRAADPVPLFDWPDNEPGHLDLDQRKRAA